MCIAVIFSITQIPTASGATSSGNPLARVTVASDTYSGAAARTLLPTQHARSTATAPEHCPDARQAVRYYGRKLSEWRVKMGAPSSARESHSPARESRAACPHVRRLAHTLQRKAHAARLRYLDWHYHEYRWDHWLPQKFYRVARCETGVRWDWDSGTYVSAWGIIRVAYEAYHPWTGHNTPREQYEVAAAIQRRFGWGAWGCGGA